MKETDITKSFRSIVDHIKSQARNTVVSAHRRSLVKGLDDKQVKQLCLIIDSAIDEAASQSIGPEARGLIRLSKK